MSNAQPDSRPLLLHVFSTFATGGPQVRFCALANHFGTAYRHIVVAMDGNTDCREKLRKDLLVDYLAVTVNKGDFFGNVARFRGVLNALEPDRLVTYNWGSIEWAIANRRAHVPHIHIEDGFGPDEQSRQLPRRVWFRRLFLRRATVVVPSRTLETIATKIWRLPRRNLRYIPNGIDLDRFTPAGSPRTPAKPVIGTVAALRPEKNLARLLQAFAIVRQRHAAALIVAGSGPELAALQAQAVSLGIAADVHFTGHLAAPQEIYRQFDVFALSSDTEQMPLSVLEAMATGLPAAATQAGDVAAMLSDANRRFVTARDAGALATALGDLIADPALRASIGAANRAKAAAEYGQLRMFAAYGALFGG